MNICPQCRRALDCRKGAHGIFWICPECGGRALKVGVLRKELKDDAFNPVWKQVWSGAGSPGRPCPFCYKSMNEFGMDLDRGGLLIDVCKTCSMVWCDGGEFESMPKAVEKRLNDLPVEARVLIIQEQWQNERDQEMLQDLKHLNVGLSYDQSQEWDGPTEPWKRILGSIGIPVEVDTDGFNFKPWLTWLAAGACLLVYLISLRQPTLVTEWAFLPAEAWRHGGLTFLTYFFLHGGVFHLVGNLYFFLVFGDNVEEALGHVRYFFLLAAATAFSAGLHGWLDPGQKFPLVGASGGIAGLLAFYAVAFPKRRLALGIWYFNFHWFRIPAFAFVFLWCGLQFIGAMFEMAGAIGISYLGHLGGLAIGLVAAIIYRRRAAQTAAQLQQEAA